MPFQVNEKAAIKLFVNLGFPTAAKWSSCRLEKKLVGLPDVIDEDTDAGESSDLLEKMLEALDHDESIQVLKDGNEVEEKPKKKAKLKPKKKRKAKGCDSGCDSDGESILEKEFGRPPHTKKVIEKPVKKTGVIASIISILEEASEKSPITRNDILGELITKFPNKEPASMMSTIKTQVPSRLKLAKGIIVEKNKEGGWWIN